MNPHTILEEIIGLLEANGVKTRREPLRESVGGLCKVKGDTILFLDAQSQPAELAAVCAEAVLNVVDIETIYIRPEVRQFIENHKNTKKDKSLP